MKNTYQSENQTIEIIGYTILAELRIKSKLDKTIYEKGIKKTDEEHGKININQSDFHGEWNYSITPNLQLFFYCLSTRSKLIFCRFTL